MMKVPRIKIIGRIRPTNNRECFIEHGSKIHNAIDSILDKHKTYLVLQELTFSVKLKHNVKKRKRKSQLK